MKSYTDIEQSKKLTKFLPIESADMCYLPTHIDDEHHFIASLSPYSMCTKMTDVSIKYCTPCWSLAALLGVLPKGTNISTPKLINALGYCCWNQYDEIYADNPVDACYELILKLNELNLL
jgi:hypothetical protein